MKMDANHVAVTKAALLAYTDLYVRNLPRSETHSIPWLRPLERKLSELLEDPEWYCNLNPLAAHLVDFFFDMGDGNGLRCSAQVDHTKHRVYLNT